MTILTTLTFQPAQLHQADAIATLVNSAYRGEVSKLGWTTEADLLDGIRTSPNAISEIIHSGDEYLLTANHQGELVGCCLISRYSPTDAYVGMVSVKPNQQGQQLGRQLLAHAELVAQTHFKATHTRMTVISVRAELIAWYERRGYMQTGEREPFPMDDPRFGIPKVSFLEFVVLRKLLNE
jgi:ribosomal protein S18 acetylase RimI-like enzyme